MDGHRWRINLLWMFVLTTGLIRSDAEEQCGARTYIDGTGTPDCLTRSFLSFMIKKPS